MALTSHFLPPLPNPDTAEFAVLAAGWTDDHRPAGIEVHRVEHHLRLEDETAVVLEMPEQGAVGDKTVRIATEPAMTAHRNTPVMGKAIVKTGRL